MANVKVDKPIYVTKYALTKGIFTFTEGEIVDGRYFKLGMMWVSPLDWTDKREDAIRYAQKLVERKKVAIQKQLAKLDRMVEKDFLIDDLEP